MKGLPMSISVIDAVGAAFGRTKRVLFQPFDFGKWFVLGFCAWLAYLGEGGGFRFQSGFNYNQRGRGGMPPEFQAVFDWIHVHLALVIFLGVCLLIVSIVIGVVLTWLQSRGKFMFLDGVVRNRGAVVEPWRQFRVQGNSLFWFRIVLGVIGLVVLVLIALVALGIAWVDIQAGEFGVAAIVGIVTGVVLFIPFFLVMLVIQLLLEDFVIPVMYLKGLRAWKAWGVFFREVAAGHLGAIILFYLLKIVLGLAVGLLTCLGCCMTCCLLGCLMALPYLGTVVLLPLFVFFRCYSLYFVQQCGPAWQVFRDEWPDGTPLPVPPPSA
jgi:hypothetical protein